MLARSSGSSLLAFCDVVVVALAFTVSVQTWGYGATTPWAELLDQRITVKNAIFVAAYLWFWHACLRSAGLYLRVRGATLGHDIRGLALASVVAVAALLPADLVLDLDFVTVAFVVGYLLLSFLALALGRVVLRIGLRRIARRREVMRNVIIVGHGVSAVRLSSELMKREDLGYRVISTIDLSTENGRNGDSHDVLERVGQLLDRELVDEMFLAPSLDNPPAVSSDLISLCESQGVLVRVLTNMADAAWEFAALDQLGGKPVFTVFPARPGMVHDVGKRITDLVVGGIGLVVLSPLFLLVAIAIKLDSPGRVFFVQERVGLHRRRLRMYKFRTMVEDAEHQQEAVEHLNEATGHCFKIAADPRKTRVGRFLRRTSLDELPQLFNVLTGEMTLVGPRPLSVRDASRIDVLTYRRRFSAKPGITCLWQIRSRQPIFDDWMQADIEYLDHWSPSLDFKILLKTIPAVLSGSGAQ